MPKQRIGIALLCLATVTAALDALVITVVLAVLAGILIAE